LKAGMTSASGVIETSPLIISKIFAILGVRMDYTFVAPSGYKSLILFGLNY
jgi:hypothetical protein